ncbi:MAG TPA: hypothetical protein VNM90_28060, partial [Haliangium sp.]|nr:hypothetical protein [Haliangium sp.]
ALRNACGDMARGLGLARTRTTGSTRDVCSAVAQELHQAQAQPEQPRQPAGTTAGATTAKPAVGAAPGTPAPAAATDARLEATLRVMRAHLPGIARLRTRAAGPLQTELQAWGHTAADLVAAGPGALRPLSSRAACMFDQLVIAAARLAIMQASLTAQIEASAAIEAAARIPVG